MDKDKNKNLKTMSTEELLNVIRGLSFEDFQFLSQQEFADPYEVTVFLEFTKLKVFCSKLDTFESKKQEIKEIRIFQFADKFKLSKKDIKTLELLADEKTYEEISDAKGISVEVGSVHKRIQRIYRKLDVNSKKEAVALFRKYKYMDYNNPVSDKNKDKAD